MLKMLAICGGQSLRKEPFSAWPVWGEEELSNLKSVLESRDWGAGPRGNRPGSRVAQFGARFAEYHEVKYGLPVNNGTVSLEIALKAGGIGFGDWVIVPAYTFVATAIAVLRVNAIPVFVDVDPETFCIDPEQVEGVITPGIKAIIPVHIAGEFSDMDKIMVVAKRHGLFVLEDAAHAIGGVWKDRKAGSIGDAGSFSFQSAKTMTCGEGGAIITDSPEIYERCILYTDFGRKENSPVYKHYVPGGNQRISEFQGAVLLAQLQRLPQQVQRREENAAYLTELLSGITGLKPQRRDPRTTTKAYFWYIFEYQPECFAGVSRDMFVRALNTEGIPCIGGYDTAVPDNPMFREEVLLKECPWVKGMLEGSPKIFERPFPNARRLAANGIVFRHNLLMSNKEDLDDIAAAIHKIIAHIDELKQFEERKQ
ncbi:hypothetical protein CVT91_01980 [Candidatus Atribacteria bacterium HGW-Atribacteria-1]|nr:MAG: hypothetical protein CVT91_01980 [Candidatus Atribacteria bacterium HGW-Atribacteria-1]